MPRLPPSLAVLEPVTVCVPARDEAGTLPDLIGDLRAQVGVPRLRVLILDDGSSDGTAEVARAAAGDDPRITVLRSEIPPPPGWTGKAAACARLAVRAGVTDALPHALAGDHASDVATHPGSDGGRPGPRTGDRPDSASEGRIDSVVSERLSTPVGEPVGTASGECRACAAESHAESVPRPSVVVFLDADVRLAPQAVAAAVADLRHSGAAMVAPWPWQRAGSLAEALVQPLLCWSWAASLPVLLGNRNRRPSTVVSCGQFLVFDARAYREIGGHASVAGSPVEDMDIARALRRSGSLTRVVAAGRLASTRMYRGAAEL
ncbi:glycosyltransferase family 2 protein, partial [Nocardia higoensis]|uniref:glycosyltransferase family 2 protein n=1 Tax=Nocardia higoensis TaxID=228599 RepID=UPI001FE056C7